MATTIPTTSPTLPRRLGANQTGTKRWLFHWLAPPHAGKKPNESWWAREDSNLQPDRYERSALTIELRARCVRTQAAPLAPHTMPRRERQSRPARAADAQENGAAESPRKPAFERSELHFEKPPGLATYRLALFPTPPPPPLPPFPPPLAPPVT